MAWKMEDIHDSQKKEYITLRICPTCGVEFWIQQDRRKKYCSFLCSVQRKVSLREYLGDLEHYHKHPTEFCANCDTQCDKEPKTCDNWKWLENAIADTRWEIMKRKHKPYDYNPDPNYYYDEAGQVVGERFCEEEVRK